MPARVGASLCRAYGIGGLVAENPSEYIDTAVEVATIIDHLINYKSALSAALETVDAGDGFARKLEHAYGALWRAKGTGLLKPGTLVPMEDQE